MKLMPNELPRPRLLTSIYETPTTASATPDGSRSDLKASFFRRHRRAFLVGALAGALLIALGIYFLYRQNAMSTEAYFVRRLVSVATHTISSGSHPSRPPAPVVVEWNIDVVQVTGIALGHPRLAVINGRQVAEGDTIIVHTPTHSVSVRLRVLRIADGQVELSDGTQVMVARLVVPPPSSTSR
jgi:hypothetical protein